MLNPAFALADDGDVNVFEINRLITINKLAVYPEGILIEALCKAPSNIVENRVGRWKGVVTDWRQFV